MRFEGLAGKLEAQGLARHSTPDLTFNVYGRSRENRLVEGNRNRNAFSNNSLRFF